MQLVCQFKAFNVKQQSNNIEHADIMLRLNYKHVHRLCTCTDYGIYAALKQ